MLTSLNFIVTKPFVEKQNWEIEENKKTRKPVCSYLRREANKIHIVLISFRFVYFFTEYHVQKNKHKEKIQ